MKVKPMSATADADLHALTEAATRIGARPFKGATGHWATAVEVALMDTILSAGAIMDGTYGAGVLPRLRAYKAFRGEANTMRLVATLGPFALDDFVTEQRHITQLMNAAGALLDAGINTAADVDPESAPQRHALLDVDGVSPQAWDYFLIILDHQTPHLEQLRNTWLDDFVARATGTSALSVTTRDALLTGVASHLHIEHHRKSYGHMPKFTVPQLHQAIFRAEYARATS